MPDGETNDLSCWRVTRGVSGRTSQGLKLCCSPPGSRKAPVGELGPDSDLTRLIKWWGVAESRAWVQRCQQHSSAENWGQSWAEMAPGPAGGGGLQVGLVTAFKDLVFSSLDSSDKYPHWSHPGLTSWSSVLVAALVRCYPAQVCYRKQSGLIFFNCYSRNNLERFNMHLLACYLLQSFCGCVLWLVSLWHQLLLLWCFPFSAQV